MKSKLFKFIILFLALLLPVCIFVFLKLFGKNEFDIPIYYQSQTAIDSTACEGIKAPYRIKPVTLKDTGQKAITINFGAAASVVFTTTDSLLSKNILRQLNRVQDRLLKGTAELMIIRPTDNIEPLEGWKQFVMGKDEFKQWQQCGLLSSDHNKFVLIDENQNIRGYYSSDDIEEVDRLIVEVKILNSKK